MQIIGASGHAKVVIEILKLNLENIAAVWDDNPDIKTFVGHTIDGKISDFNNPENDLTIISIGNNEIRKKIAEIINTEFGVAIHPTSAISPSVVINAGTVVMPNTSINAGAKIGKHVIINTNASVDHDCNIKDYVHISPQVALAGNVSIGEGTHIGIGACVIQNIKIGKWATIGAGSVIIKDIPDYAVVVGNPGKIIKYKHFNPEYGK